MSALNCICMMAVSFDSNGLFMVIVDTAGNRTSKACIPEVLPQCFPGIRNRQGLQEIGAAPRQGPDAERAWPLIFCTVLHYVLIKELECRGPPPAVLLPCRGLSPG